MKKSELRHDLVRKIVLSLEHSHTLPLCVAAYDKKTVADHVAFLIELRLLEAPNGSDDIYQWEGERFTDAGCDYLEAVQAGTEISSFGTLSSACDPEPHPEFPSLGKIEVACPYCNQFLVKRPTRKTKCVHCKHPIFVTKRPSDLQQVLVTASQKEEIAEQWAIVNGEHEQYITTKKQVAEEKSLLAQQIGHYPNDLELEWQQLECSMSTHAHDQSWGLFRNAKLGMAEIRRKEGNFSEAVGLYLEVCYIDVNGPQNTSDFTDCSEDDMEEPLEDGELEKYIEEWRNRFPPWKPENMFAGLNKWTINRVISVSKKAGMTLPYIEAVFYKHASFLFQSINTPLAPSAVWPIIQEAISDAV